MKFYSTPNMLVIPRKTGIMKRFRPFRFDGNGVFETDNPILIRAMKAKFKHDEVEVAQTEPQEEVIEDKPLSDEEIRSLAKEQKIKSWHTKSIENLKKELGV